MARDDFAALADLLPEAMLLVDGDGVVRAANAACAGLLRRAAEGIAGLRLADLVDDDEQVVADLLRAAARTRSLIPAAVTLKVDAAASLPCRCEACVFRPRSATAAPLVLLRLTPKQAAVNRFVELNHRIGELSREVVRRRHAEATARAYAERLRVTLASIGDAVIATDRDGRVTLMNGVASALTGWPDADANGKPLDEVFTIINQHTRQRVESPTAEVLREGKVVGLANHTVLVARDGTERPIDDSAAPIHADDGRLLGVVLVFRDISERYAMQRELAERAERLIEADRQKDQFLAMLAHELRNPLAPLNNGVHLLLAEKSDSTVRIAQMLQRQVTHLARLVDDLLDVARITSGRIELRMAPVDLGAVMQQAVEMSRALLDARNHRLTTSPPPAGTTMVRADATRLVQVLVNLLSNAAVYTPEGGAITFDCDGGAGQATITVRDNGIGIDPAQQARVFDLFVQGDRSLDRRQGGLGIGLTVARALVEMHGGSISLHSEGVGRGSEFSVRLPLLHDAQPFAAPSTPASAAGHATLRVLVVDDNDDAANSLAVILKEWGCEVEVAADAVGALARWEAFRPDAVLLDIGLPGMDGYDLARQLRRLPRGAGTLLVAVTGYGQPLDRQLSREASIDLHLTKPVAIDALRVALSARAGAPRA